MSKTKSTLYMVICSVLLCGCTGKSEEPVWKTEAVSEADKTQPPAQSRAEQAVPQQGETEQVKQIYYVHVCGKVSNPDVYALPEGSRVVDAVHAAGGLTEDACETAINLALPISDGMQIYVPDRTQAQEAMSGGAASMDDGLVNINTADVSELCSLPGIGKSRAESIIAYREERGPFSDISEIMNVSGIKDAGFAKIRDYIKVNE